MSDFSHLNDSAKGMLSLDDAQRIEKIRSDRWIGYSKAKSILNKLEDLLVHPRTERMLTYSSWVIPIMAKLCW